MTSKVISKLKNRFIKNKNITVQDEEYKFSLEEIEDLKEQNKQKLENLKIEKKERKKLNFTSISKKLDGLMDEQVNEEIPIKENILLEESQKNEELKNEDNKKIESTNQSNNESEVEETKDSKNIDIEMYQDKNEISDNQNQESYINLAKKTQDIIMQSWNNIDLQQVDKDIIEGKDLINHNYNITYGDKAAKFVHDIRKRYEVVICYLIGFNNEKKGIMNKTIFADKVDDEWKYLNKYIKLLEKIRSFRK